MAQGIRKNLQPFLLLVLINAFVGAMVGIERSVLPNLAEVEFGLASKAAAVSFLISFGSIKALGNLLAGRLADRMGRKRILIAGWLAGLPVPYLVIFGPSWAWIVIVNAFLGVNQALCWSVTLIMKIDLAGPRNRGLATALNEWAGYLGVALAALATGWLAARFSVRPTPFYLGIGLTIAGLSLSLFARERAGMWLKRVFPMMAGAALRSKKCLPEPHGKTVRFWPPVRRDLQPISRTAWYGGLVPILLANQRLSYQQIGTVAAVYPVVWGFGQLITGPLSDRWGRKWMVVAGMLT